MIVTLWCWENAYKEKKITVGYNTLFLFSILDNQLKMNSPHWYHHYKRPKHLCQVPAYSNRKDIWHSKSDNILIMNAVPRNHFAIFIGLTHKKRQIYSFHSLNIIFTVWYFCSLSSFTVCLHSRLNSKLRTSYLSFSLCLSPSLSTLKWLHFIFGYSKENIRLPELPP